MVPLVLVLIAAPGELKDAIVGEARTLFGRDERAKPAWLAREEACEIALFADSEGHGSEIRERVEREIAQGALGGRPLDVALVRGDHRRKKLLVADMESTIIEQECLDELAGFVGLREEISAITDRAMRGELEFEAALRQRVALLAGLDEDTLEHVMAERVTLTPGARTLVQTMKANGAVTALVSGGFSFFASRVARMVGFDACHSNELLIAGGKLTGAVAEPILGQEAKLDALAGHRERLDLLAAETLAVGDGANDRAMIRAAGLGVAFRAKPAVVAEAHASIVHGDLAALLYFQGYRREEFVV